MTASGFGLLTIERLAQCLEIRIKVLIDALTLNTLRIQSRVGFIRMNGAVDQKSVVRLAVFHKSFERSSAEFLRPGVVEHLQLLVRLPGRLEQLARLSPLFVQQNGLETLTQKIVQWMRFALNAVQPGTRCKRSAPGRPKSLAPHIVIEGVEPFVGQAAGTGILGQGQLTGGRYVVSRHARTTANAILEP